MYSFDSRVMFSEVDEKCRLSVPALVNYFQNCSTLQSDDLGVGYNWLSAQNLVWVVNFWQIIIDAKPALSDRIKVGTAPHAFKSFMGQRNFALFDENGKYLARANSIWTLLDTRTGRPTIIPDIFYEKYKLETPIEMEYAPRKIKVPEGGQTMKAFAVQPFHLDPNHHVNNGQYVSLAAAYLEDGFEVKELRVEYSAQARLGDMIYPYVIDVPEGRIVALNDESGKHYAVTLFMEDKNA